MLTGYDSVTAAHLPLDGDVYLAYISGSFANLTEVRDRVGGKPVLTVATAAQYDADVLDVERFDAVPAQAPSWFDRQIDRGVQRPILYTSVSAANALVALMAGAHIYRSTFRLWTAHYTNRPHLCALQCAFNGTADATQWSTSPPNPGYDQSQLAADFLANPTPTPAPVMEDIAMIVTFAGAQAGDPNEAPYVLDSGMVPHSYSAAKMNYLMHLPAALKPPVLVCPANAAGSAQFLALRQAEILPAGAK